MPNSWQVVIALGRPFDVQVHDTNTSRDLARRYASTREITIPFDDRESAEGAQRDIRVWVREVHDAGGEDYRPVVPGVVVGDASELMGKRVLIGEIERGDGNP